MGMMKVFSGSERLASALKAKIEEAGIDVVVKDNAQSSRMNKSDLAVELFIDESHYGKAHSVIEAFRMSI